MEYTFGGMGTLQAEVLYWADYLGVQDLVSDHPSLTDVETNIAYVPAHEIVRDKTHAKPARRPVGRPLLSRG